MPAPDSITILGGGPAGLAAGYFAKARALPFRIYEAAERAGGNAITLSWDGFRFDSGAHRFHDKDPEITAEIRRLLGPELLEVRTTSHIYYGSKLIDFPLSPLNLARSMAPIAILRATAAYASARLRRASPHPTFEDAAVRRYGRVIADAFLLGYSEKLWGRPCHRLSPSISGARLKGLEPARLFKEILRGERARPAHMEGRFFYPRLGFGAIVQKLAAACGSENIACHSAAVSIGHDQRMIRSVTLGDGRTLAVSQVVSSIPLPEFLRVLRPAPPSDVLDLGNRLAFRNLTLVAVFVAKDRITSGATVYFPGREFPFTRAYEPKNRSAAMSPPGKTSLCVEYPCFSGDAAWTMGRDRIIETTIGHLERIGWIRRSEILGADVIKMSHAYPVLESEADQVRERIFSYLAGFKNLKTIGRNGRFVYAHVHDMLRFGRDAVEEIARERRGAAVPSEKNLRTGGDEDRVAETPQGVMGLAYGRARKSHPAIYYRYRTRARVVSDAVRRNFGISAPLQILDLGCADGGTMLEMSRLLGAKHSYTGVEYSPQLVALSEPITDVHRNIRVVRGDIARLPDEIARRSYDLVTALAVLEHLADPGEALGRAAALLKPGGGLIATFPNPFWDRLSTRLGMLAEHHQHFLTAEAMAGAMSKAGLEMIEFKRFMWAPVSGLPYLRIPVSPEASMLADRSLRRLKVMNGLFVNQLLVARKRA